MDLNKILRSSNQQQYKFPIITPNIESIVAIRKPNDIDIAEINSNEEYFHRFIQQVNEWLEWFDRFITHFQYVVEWLKNRNIIGASQLLIDLYDMRNNEAISLIQLKVTIEKTLIFLKPFNDLRRLCHLFNCLTTFQIIDFGGVNNQIDSQSYIRDLKRLQPNNSFTVHGKTQQQHTISINDRQNVQWFLASEKYSCNVEIEYRTIESHECGEIVFSNKDIPIDKHIISGVFETQRSGQLMITIDSRDLHAQRIIWFQLKSSFLSTCNLFDAIFNIFYQRYYANSLQAIKDSALSKLLDEVFSFIDKLLIGTISLREMTDLKAVFCDKNIHVRDEVKKLFTNRSTAKKTVNQEEATTAVTYVPSEQEIEQVCEWLQIYQYYSHINIIIDCIQTFEILPKDNEDDSIGHLKRLSGNENCSLKDITQAYKILQQRFGDLTGKHLQLIKTTVECSAVVVMMKKSDLYSSHGRRRFQELRDNLTTQFQFQERNNMILNSLIITYPLCEPFMFQAKNLQEFVDRFPQLLNFDESSLKHIIGKHFSFK